MRKGEGPGLISVQFQKKKIETPLLLKLTPLRIGDKRRYNIAIRDKHLFSFSQRVEKVKCNHEAPPILSI